MLPAAGVRIAPVFALQSLELGNTPLHGNMVGDGAGNYFAALYDWRNGNLDTYIQKFDESGTGLWTSGGVAVASGAGFHFPYGVTYDGAGGAFVVWLDNTASQYYVQRIDSTGAVASGWPGGGVAFTPGGDTSYAMGDIHPDGSGGVVIAYHNNGEIYVTRIDEDGAKLWGANGTKVSDPTATPSHGIIVAMISDGAGGAYVAWDHNLNSGADHDLRMVKLDSSGALVSGWTANGTTVSGTNETGYYQKLTLVGSNVVIAWQEGAANDDIKAQMYDASGAAQWTGGGVTVAAASNDQRRPVAVPSGTGAIVVWSDFRNGSNYDLYAQKLDASGAVEWAANGVAVSDAAGDQGQYQEFRAVSDGSDGVMVTWADTRTSDTSIYAERFDSDGDSQWAADGLLIHTSAGGDANAFTGIASDGSGGAVFAFGGFNSLVGDVNVTVQHLVSSVSTDTTSNFITLSRLKAGATSTVDIGFTLANTLNGTLTVTFPVGFTVTAAATGGSSCLSGFGFTASTLTATKTLCSGAITMTGATVTNPSTPGSYNISWVNDDPGEGEVYIMDDDQVTVTADVNATLTFDIDVQSSCGSESAAPYAVSLGALTTASVTTAASKICLDLDTNAAAGARVTVQGSGAVDGLESAGSGDSIGTAYGASPVALVAGTEGYGLCVESTSAVTGSATASAPYNGSCGSHLVGGVDASAPQAILTTGDDPIDGTSNDTAAIRVKASVSTTTAAANDYTDVLTFVATGTF